MLQQPEGCPREVASTAAQRPNGSCDQRRRPKAVFAGNRQGRGREHHLSEGLPESLIPAGPIGEGLEPPSHLLPGGLQGPQGLSLAPLDQVRQAGPVGPGLQVLPDL